MIYVHHSSNKDPAFHLALELSLLYAPWPNEVTDIVLTYMNQPSVIMGRFQNPWMEVNLDLLRDNNVSLMRRMTGGGCVYHDEGNINFSVITNRQDYNRSWALQTLVQTMSYFGKELIENHRYDLYYKGGKVTGSAMRKTKDRFLHHFTLIGVGDGKFMAEILNHNRDVSSIVANSKSVHSLRVPTEQLFLPLEWNSMMLSEIRTQFGKNWSSRDQGKLLDLPSSMLRAETSFLEQMNSLNWIYGETPDFEIVKDGHKFLVQNGIMKKNSMDFADVSLFEPSIKSLNLILTNLKK